jgi:hypothetical protein
LNSGTIKRFIGRYFQLVSVARRRIFMNSGYFDGGNDPAPEAWPSGTLRHFVRWPLGASSDVADLLSAQQVGDGRTEFRTAEDVDQQVGANVQDDQLTDADLQRLKDVALAVQGQAQFPAADVQQRDHREQTQRNQTGH